VALGMSLFCRLSPTWNRLFLLFLLFGFDALIDFFAVHSHLFGCIHTDSYLVINDIFCG